MDHGPSTIFITGIGTDVGKTLVSAIVTEALEADYWKPVQAGYADGTDALSVQSLLSNPQSVVHKEVYRLRMPASPHIAARKEGVSIQLSRMVEAAAVIGEQCGSRPLVIEGAGGLLVPMNENETVADLIRALQARVILVSRNYLGSINHSLLTAAYCKAQGFPVAGWMFNDDYMQYETEITNWSGYPALGSIPKLECIDRDTIRGLALQMRPALTSLFNQHT